MMTVCVTRTYYYILMYSRSLAKFVHTRKVLSFGEMLKIHKALKSVTEPQGLY